ncbi:N-6 DNA methylase [Campylobacter armoricus]|uniref:N-6 DNA methylase n=1 Tax=Campylobacter armoricus TaxID=2505970 RepID=UPI001F0110B0|nr:N-6 DNA methylase [Campylobacter armoricus]
MIEEILKDSDYKLDLFSKKAIAKLETKIIAKTNKNNQIIYYTNCLVRDKEIKLTPEEIVRQLYIDKLLNEYNYPKDRIKVEYEIKIGSEHKRADIVILYDKETQRVRLSQDSKARQEYIIIELKKPKQQDGVDQLKSYTHATGVPFCAWCNGEIEINYHRNDPNSFMEIRHLPSNGQDLDDILSEEFKYIDLLKEDVLAKEKISLKSKILLIEDDVLANSGENAFEEVFKLIFTKLFDELKTYRKDSDLIKEYNIISKYNNNKERLEELYKKMSKLEFAIYEKDDEVIYKRIQSLFDEAKEKWKGIFSVESKIALTPSHLAICVSSLQKCKFFNSNLEVIDDAFEYLANKDSKGEKGQFFTPRYVIDMCVKMLNPKKDESMIDTASGSCGFPIHTCFYVWRQIYKECNREENEMLTAEEKIPEAKEYVKNKVFAIDFDSRTVRISKMLNLIAGDGHTNVYKLNSLDFLRWENQKSIDDATAVFNENLSSLYKFASINDKNASKEKDRLDLKHFNFDIVMANPPFAGNVKESVILENYDLAKTINLEKIKDEEAQKSLNIHAKMPTFPEVMGTSRDPQIIVKTEKGYKKIKVKQQVVVSRDILFIERNLNMLKPGGRMAIVLPQGRFNNSSDKHIREFIADKARILAVVGLHGNVFKPHTGTKTSVLFLQKWDDKLCPKCEDYNIFFATMNEPSKDNSGDKIYLKEQRVLIKRKNGKNTINDNEELTLSEFYSKYKDVEGTEIIEYENRIITPDEYSLLSKDEKKKAILREVVIFDTPMLDSHGHLIIKHDLFNHDGLTQDGIAEAFIEFAKSENLSFWKE